MQQLTAHVPSQIELAKSLLGLTPIMANEGQIDKYRQMSSDIDKLRILSLVCSCNTGSKMFEKFAANNDVCRI